ncbi:TPA: site-specific DNA-methyltransferase [Klebsiella pneumoniae]|nr:site-specific DNA-methyltransferase [Klebsiella pneumoniae]HCG2949209.1 site-specific DNA-methyltransferase [Klebsiella pneumoniae]
MEKITADSAESKSLDITQQNIEQLKALFPDVFSEGKIDFEALKSVLGEAIDDSAERYNFTWNGKNKARQIAQTPSTGTLRPCKEESVNWDTTENLFIEGDNLEVLKLLQKSYHKKIKMIYIDPPYNTGKDFVYKDNFHDNIKNYLEITGQVDSEGNKINANSDTSGRYHSDWLNMMYPRLKLARNLLSDDGAIFISIDENEINNLKNIMNEVFGEDNYITDFCWEKKKKPSFLNKNLGTKFEYIVVYAKNRDLTGAFSVDLTEEGKKYPVNNAGNTYAKIKFPAGKVNFNMPDQSIEPQDMSEGKIKTKLVSAVIIKNGVNANDFEIEGEWRYSQTKIDQIIADGEKIVISKIPFRPNHIKKGGEVKKMHNLLTIGHYGLPTNEDSDAELTKIFGKSYFDYSKPSGLIKFLIKSFMYNDKNGIVLDFFGGSGTTADALTQLNLEDHGERRFLVVQLPEPCPIGSNAQKDGLRTIADIAKTRIKRTLANDQGVFVFKLDETNIRPWESDFDNLEQSLLSANESIKADRSVEDVLYEILLKYGIELTIPVEEQTVQGKQVYVVGAGALIVCLDDNITAEVVEGIAVLKQELDPETTQVVFKDAGFADSVVKTNAIQILKQAGIDDVKSI